MAIEKIRGMSKATLRILKQLLSFFGILTAIFLLPYTLLAIIVGFFAFINEDDIYLQNIAISLLGLTIILLVIFAPKLRPAMGVLGIVLGIVQYLLDANGAVFVLYCYLGFILLGGGLWLVGYISGAGGYAPPAPPKEEPVIFIPKTIQEQLTVEAINKDIRDRYLERQERENNS